MLNRLQFHVSHKRQARLNPSTRAMRRPAEECLPRDTQIVIVASPTFPTKTCDVKIDEREMDIIF